MRLPIQLQKQQIILIIGIGLALIAIFMIKVYLDEQNRAARLRAKQELEAIQANQTPVLIAKKDIAQGVVIDPDWLEAKIVPNNRVEGGAVKSVDRISGMLTVAPISKGEQVTLDKLSFKRSGDLASLTPVGKRAITIVADNASTLVGMIKAGDYVDVIALVNIPIQVVEGRPVTQLTSIPLFQNVLILAVGQETGGTAPAMEQLARYGKQQATESSALITLALSPKEAGLLSFVQEQGKIRLVLRSPTDAKVEPTQLATWDTLFQYVMPPQQRADEPKPISFIEVYHGLQKERVPVYK
ncbi:MAG: Flp pilus assembly protein CpaB [Candidatus Omnitrophica bacterium]|nr:Flp pilus assembly protein CpaB [Candidatus Omnitrophota bacterium]